MKRMRRRSKAEGRIKEDEERPVEVGEGALEGLVAGGVAPQPAHHPHLGPGLHIMELIKSAGHGKFQFLTESFI